MEKDDLPAMGPKQILPAIDVLQPPLVVNCTFFCSVVPLDLHQLLTALCKDDLVRIGMDEDCDVTISTMDNDSITMYSHIIFGIYRSKVKFTGFVDWQ